LPSNATEARVLLRRTDLDREADRMAQLCRKLRRRLDRSLLTLVPIRADQDPETPVRPPPEAWTMAFEALSIAMRALLQHQRDGQKIQLAALKLAGKDEDMTPEEEAEEIEAAVRERLEYMTPEELEAELERKRQQAAIAAAVEV
jgi:hypothetical protein